MKNPLAILALMTLAVFLFPIQLLATSGCCSWHGGVCGCSGGSQLCCDGSLSPSCTCYSPPPQPPKKPITKVAETEKKQMPDFEKLFNETKPKLDECLENLSKETQQSDSRKNEVAFLKEQVDRTANLNLTYFKWIIFLVACNIFFIYRLRKNKH